MRGHLVTILIAASLFASNLAWSTSKQEERLLESNRVFQQIMNTPDKGIPQDLLARAVCIGIIPSVKKAAFIVGAEHGAGFVFCRKDDNGPWGPPSGFSVSGGSFGFQIGGSATDFVLLFMNKDGMEKLLQDKFTLGADASIAGGPVGRTASAGTDAQMTAKVLSYSRSKGLFAGLALDGAVLKPSDDDNEALYGKKLSPKDILLGGNIQPPAAANALIQKLNTYSPKETKRAL